MERDIREEYSETRKDFFLHEDQNKAKTHQAFAKPKIFSCLTVVVRSADYWPTVSVCLCSLTDRLEERRTQAHFNRRPIIGRSHPYAQHGLASSHKDLTHQNIFVCFMTCVTS